MTGDQIVEYLARLSLTSVSLASLMSVRARISIMPRRLR